MGLPREISVRTASCEAVEEVRQESVCDGDRLIQSISRSAHSAGEAPNSTVSAPIIEAGARPPPALACALNSEAGSAAELDEYPYPYGRDSIELAALTAELNACVVASCVGPAVSFPRGETAAEAGAEPKRRRGESGRRDPVGPPRSPCMPPSGRTDLQVDRTAAQGLAFTCTYVAARCRNERGLRWEGAST